MLRSKTQALILGITCAGNVKVIPTFRINFCWFWVRAQIEARMGGLATNYLMQ